MHDGRGNLARRILQDAQRGMRLLLWVGLLQELVMMAVGLWPAAWLVLRYAPSATNPWHWVLLILGAVLLFNYGYLAALLAFRIVLPRPKEGLYVVQPGRRVPGQVILFMLNMLLVKARFEPPWAAMFSTVLANTWPLRPLFNRFFGPRGRSIPFGDVIYMTDPHMVHIGRNVQLGFHCTIIGHVYDNRGLLIRHVKVGDHAVIGGESTIMAGVEIGEHAVIGVRSVVRPDTIIRPYEYWAGIPATKVKDLVPGNEPSKAVGPVPREHRDRPSAPNEPAVLRGQEGSP